MDLSSESDRQRFKPGQSKVEGTDTSVEAYLRDELELVAIDKDCEPSGLLPTLDPIKKILELNHFFVREMVANGLELMKPEVYRAIAEAAAKGGWLKGEDLT